MSVSAEVYRVAAMEHMTAACKLHETQNHVLSHYVAGLAVECIFRAYITRKRSHFDNKHDLRNLAKSAGFFAIISTANAEAMGVALGVVVERWLNSHRYRSVQAMESFLRGRGLNRGVKGDFLKENSRLIVNAAFEIVSLGSRQWKSSSKN
jgi:hypothetical protein